MQLGSQWTTSLETVRINPIKERDVFELIKVQIKTDSKEIPN